MISRTTDMASLLFHGGRAHNLWVQCVARSKEMQRRHAKMAWTKWKSGKPVSGCTFFTNFEKKLYWSTGVVTMNKRAACMVISGTMTSKNMGSWMKAASSTHTSSASIPRSLSHHPFFNNTVWQVKKGVSSVGEGRSLVATYLYSPLAVLALQLQLQFL